MAEEPMGLAITKDDLVKLAEINPLAWEQLLHIMDMRMATERINRLEEENARLSDRHTDVLDLVEDRTVLSSASVLTANGHIEGLDEASA